MKKGAFLMITAMLGVALWLLSASAVKAQTTETTPPDSNPSETKSELPPSPVRDAVLELLKPEQWFKKLQEYIRVPLPGTGVKEIDVEKEKISELNIQITRETGVDIIKFFQFIGKILVIILEGITRLIRGLLVS